MLRQILFWAHLVAGLVAGLSIGVMCFTGTTLAFEKQIVAWVERDVRRVTPPAPDAARLPLAELAERVRTAQPEARFQSITVSSDPRDAVAFSAGRDTTLYADPYTGAVHTPNRTGVHTFLRSMEELHRWLALSGEQRALGKAINGACNLAFCFLAISGLYLWWPRTWSWRGVRAVATLNWRLTGKARDFNWHNAIGLWSAPVLIVLTLTAVPISYRWGGDLLNRLAGDTTAAPAGGPNAAPAENFKIERPAPDARPLPQEELLARAQTAHPQWRQLSLRSGGPARGAARPAEPAPHGPQPITIIVREADAWPRTAVTTLTLNPFTGEVLKRETPADLAPGRRLRGWTRFLHTGEALGLAGQFVAGLASLGGCFLVYTGFALAWRRFVPARTSRETPAK